MTKITVAGLDTDRGSKLFVVKVKFPWNQFVLVLKFPLYTPFSRKPNVILASRTCLEKQGSTFIAYKNDHSHDKFNAWNAKIRIDNVLWKKILLRLNIYVFWLSALLKISIQTRRKTKYYITTDRLFVTTLVDWKLTSNIKIKVLRFRYLFLKLVEIYYYLLTIITVENWKYYNKKDIISYLYRYTHLRNVRFFQHWTMEDTKCLSFLAEIIK